MRNTRRKGMPIQHSCQTEGLFSCMTTDMPDLLQTDFGHLAEVEVEAGLVLEVRMHQLSMLLSDYYFMLRVLTISAICTNLLKLPTSLGLTICTKLSVNQARKIFSPVMAMVVLQQLHGYLPILQMLRLLIGHYLRRNTWERCRSGFCCQQWRNPL